MAHYAKVVPIPLSKPRMGVVTTVIVAEADFIATYRDNTPGEWIQTSYNTFNNKYYSPVTGKVDPAVLPLRGNFAGCGYLYDYANDVFYMKSPYPSWTLNTSTWSWEPPTPRPTTANVEWDEDTLIWKQSNL
jgi:hypothetical protein